MIEDAQAPLSRRSVLRGAGGVAAVTALSTFSGPAFAASNGKRVAIFGGGPGGLTAAHELAERGFRVDLYERHEVLGGKCRSFSVPGTGRGGRKDLPGEVGPHGFIGAYQNLGETLARIPTGAGRTVLDEIGTGGPNVKLKLGWDGAVVTLPFAALAGPSSQPNALLGALPHLKAADLVSTVTGALKLFPQLANEDVAILGSKIVALFTSGPKRQKGHFENLRLSDYVHSDRMSENGMMLLHTLLQGAPVTPERQGTRPMVRGAFWNIFLDPLIAGYQFGPGFEDMFALSKGPMNESFFDPWGAHLTSLGARIHTRQTLTRLSYSGGRISGAEIQDAKGRTTKVEADYYVLAVPADKAARLMNPQLVAADPALGRIKLLEQTWLGGMQINLTQEAAPALGSGGGAIGQPWIPAYFIPTQGLWERDFAKQYGDGTVVEQLSVDLADFDAPGVLYGKSAKHCTDQEMFEELRAQIRNMLGDQSLLPDSQIHSWIINPALGKKKGSAPRVHDEPGWAGTPGCWNNQPEAATRIPNFFLGASYVRSRTGVDCMDSANEAGKMAANAILAASASRAKHSKIASWEPAPALKALWTKDDILYSLGQANVFDIVAPTRPDKSILAARS